MTSWWLTSTKSRQAVWEPRCWSITVTRFFARA